MFVRPLTYYSRTYSLFAILMVCGHFPWSTTYVCPSSDYSRTYSLFAILTVCGHFPWSTTYVCPSSDRLQPYLLSVCYFEVCGHFAWSTTYVCPSSDRLQPYLLSVCYFDGLWTFSLIDHVCLSVLWQTTIVLTLCLLFWRSVDIFLIDHVCLSVRLTDYNCTYSLFAILTVCGHFPWSTTYVCPSSDRLQQYLLSVWYFDGLWTFPWSTTYVCPSSDRLQPYLLSVCYFDGLWTFSLIDHVRLSVLWQTTAVLTVYIHLANLLGHCDVGHDNRQILVVDGTLTWFGNEINVYQFSRCQ